ncbi:hypothetical protein ISCGN_029806 [Ixodes scapularis]
MTAVQTSWNTRLYQHERKFGLFAAPVTTTPDNKWEREIRMRKTFTEDDFKRIYLCSAPQNDCFLRRCEKCPKMQSISLQSLHLDEDEEICYALWDAGELVKKAEAAAQNHLRGDLGLVLKTKARLHALAAMLDEPYVFEHKPFALQYEVQFQQKFGRNELDSSGSSTNVGGGLPRGEVAPSRRHSLPVLLSPETPRESKDWLQVSQNNNNNSPTVLKNRSHIEFPTNFFASARASIPMCNGRLPVRDPFDDVYDVEIAVTKPMVTFDLDSLESSAI